MEQAQEKVRENKRNKLRREGPYPQEQGNSFSLGGIIIPQVLHLRMCFIFLQLHARSFGAMLLKQVPFGAKEYEGVESERFDLIGPYAEEGYVDVSADAMSRLRNFFSFGRKQDDSSNLSKDKRKQQQRNGKNKFK
jgi:hypothetical protein